MDSLKDNVILVEVDSFEADQSYRGNMLLTLQVCDIREVMKELVDLGFTPDDFQSVYSEVFK